MEVEMAGARQREQEEVALEVQGAKQRLEAVWASRVAGWEAECSHLREREKKREYRKQLIERHMMATQIGFHYTTREWREAYDDFEVWEEMDEDDMLGPMREAEIEQ